MSEITMNKKCNQERAFTVEEKLNDILLKLDEIKRDLAITDCNFQTLHDAETDYHFDLSKLDHWLCNQFDESKNAVNNAYRIVGYVEELVKQINSKEEVA